jgi:hypothetical protein
MTTSRLKMETQLIPENSASSSYRLLQTTDSVQHNYFYINIINWMQQIPYEHNNSPTQLVQKSPALYVTIRSITVLTKPNMGF